MPAERQWTESEIARARQMREDRKTWQQIAAELGCVVQTARVLAKKHGFWTKGLTTALPKPEVPRVPSLIERPPLPAGHSVTWGLLTAGTCLEGSRYTPPALYR